MATTHVSTDSASLADFFSVLRLRKALIALSVDALGRKPRWEGFKGIAPEDCANPVNSVLIPDQSIQNLRQAWLVSDQKVTQLKARLGEAHPDLVSVMENRAKTKDLLDARLAGSERALEIGCKEAAARVAGLKHQLSRAKVDRIFSAGERRRMLEDAAIKFENEPRLAPTPRLTLRQREIDFPVPRKTIGTLNTALPTHLASQPNWALNTTVAVRFGAVLALGVALLLDYFDTSFRDVADVESRLKLPVLGVILFQRNPLGTVDDDPANTEPFRGLQPKLNRALKPGQPHALVLFSAGPGEGKSSTLHRLAAPRGAGGERVVRIDSDLRRPTQHRLANRPQGPGLGDFLLGQHTRDEVTQKPVSPGGDFTPGGTYAGFTLGLLHANRLRDRIATLRGRCDRIVLALPPIIGLVDTRVLARAVDGAVLRIQHRRNPRSRVLRTQESVGSLKTPLLGVVLNQVPLHSGEDDGYYPNNDACYSDGSGEKNRRSHASSAPRPTADQRVLSERGPEAKGWGDGPRICR